MREEEIEEQHRQQLDQRATTMLVSKAPKFAAIHSNRIKTIRHLSQVRKQVEALNRTTKPTIVQKYADYGSTG